MELDLRKHGLLSYTHAQEIDSIEPKVRGQYNEYIDLLTKINNIQGKHWLLRTTCRNTYTNNMLDSFCRIALLQNILERGELINSIRVDDDVFGVVVSRIVRACGYHIEIYSENSKTNNGILFVMNFFKSLLYLSTLFLIPKLIRKPVCYIPEDITMVESFITSIEVASVVGTVEDRFYPGMLNYVENKDKVWFFVNIVGIHSLISYISVLKKVRGNSANLLIKEDWLCFLDYLKVFFESFFIPMKIKRIPLWEGVNVSEIVNSENNKDFFSPSLLDDLLLYSFFRRLAQNNINIRIIIDWFENQTSDRALNIAAHSFFSQTYVKGYQGFVAPSYYACQQPTCYEYNSGMLPNEICVMGNAYIKNRFEYCKKYIKVVTAPAFRSSFVHGYLKKNDSKNILLVLPFLMEDSKRMIDMCLEAKKKYDIEIIVKPHHHYSLELFKQNFSQSEYLDISFTDNTVANLIPDCLLLFTGASSVSLEAVSVGIPVIILGSLSGPTMNPLREYVSSKLYYECYTASDLYNILSSVDKNSGRKCLNKREFFKEVNASNVRDFLFLRPLDGDL